MFLVLPLFHVHTEKAQKDYRIIKKNTITNLVTIKQNFRQFAQFAEMCTFTQLWTNDNVRIFLTIHGGKKTSMFPCPSKLRFTSIKRKIYF